MEERRTLLWRYGLLGLVDMRENGTPLWKVGLLGFLAGAVGGFLASLFSMWLDANEAGGGFVFSWPSAVIYMIIAGLVFAAVWVLVVWRRRKADRTASGPAGRATTSEIP